MANVLYLNTISLLVNTLCPICLQALYRYWNKMFSCVKYPLLLLIICLSVLPLGPKQMKIRRCQILAISWRVWNFVIQCLQGSHSMGGIWRCEHHVKKEHPMKCFLSNLHWMAGHNTPCSMLPYIVKMIHCFTSTDNWLKFNFKPNSSQKSYWGGGSAWINLL